MLMTRGVTYSVMSFPQTVHIPANCTSCLQGSSISRSAILEKIKISGEVRCALRQKGRKVDILRLAYYIILSNLPFQRDAIILGTILGRIVDGFLLLFAKLVGDGARRFEGIGKQRCGALDLLARGNEQGRHSNGVVQRLR